MYASPKFSVLIFQIVGGHTLLHHIVVEPFALLLNIFRAQSTNFKVNLTCSFRAHWCVRINSVLLNWLVTKLLAKVELRFSAGSSWSSFAFWWQSLREESSCCVVGYKTPLDQCLLAIAWRQDLLLLLLDHCLLLHPALVLLIHQHWLLLLEYHLLSLCWCCLCALWTESVTLHLISIYLHIVLNLLPLEATCHHAWIITSVHIFTIYVLVLLLVEVEPLTEGLGVLVDFVLPGLVVHFHLYSIQLLLAWLYLCIDFFCLHVIAVRIVDVVLFVSALHRPHVDDLVASLHLVFVVLETLVIWNDVLHLLVAHVGS